jgi:CubicO group peptidase (beta-lactamase class C family)
MRKQNIMKKILKYVIIILVLIPIVFLTILSIVYNPTYVYRLVVYNVGDVYDYKHFEKRVIETTDSVYYFQKKLEEEYVESLFVDQINNSGCNNFDEWVEKSKTTALIFIRHDTILYEKYFNGFKRDSYFHSMSMAKSYISALIGFAIQDGFISDVRDPITKYIPELKERDMRFEKITIRNLLMMQSGLEYYQGYFPGTFVHLPWHDEAIAYYHPEVRKLLLEDIEIKAEPGKTYQYNNYSTNYLGLILERATKKNVSEYLKEKLWTQIDTEYNALFGLDSKKSGFELMPSMLVARAIDYAKFGRLFLNDGNWNGKQVISKEWVSESILEDKSIPRKYYPDYMGNGNNRTYYKYQWWGHINDDSTHNYSAVGNLGQTIYIIPHEEIIIVHCGNSNALYDARNDLWQVERLIKYKDFHHLITHKGVKAGIEEFRIKRKNNSDSYPINERTINTKGYAYLNNGKIEEAILLFLLNVELFPTSSNVYDSQAEAYMINGDKQKAISNYQKALELNPNNLNAKKMINELTRNSP